MCLSYLRCLLLLRQMVVGQRLHPRAGLEDRGGSDEQGAEVGGSKIIRPWMLL